MFAQPMRMAGQKALPVFEPGAGLSALAGRAGPGAEHSAPPARCQRGKNGHDSIGTISYLSAEEMAQAKPAMR
ncbi:hypothetical protein BG36_13660 [Aquamicrobium defluvii]|uniref:Uncharacterized protein n=1 Tax=Aquamicrobium defluvii TaxID=69279 RepID=A0A011V330_9HYPH|nr:hypothetical protein BG36_13660 [Aquamicrobium defluvii]